VEEALRSSITREPKHGTDFLSGASLVPDLPRAPTLPGDRTSRSAPSRTRRNRPCCWGERDTGPRATQTTMDDRPITRVRSQQIHGRCLIYNVRTYTHA